MVLSGSAYKTETAVKPFIHYIAESQRRQLKHNVLSARFFSVLMDGSCDAGNFDNELLLVVWFDKEGANEKIPTHASYFNIPTPSSVTGNGLYQVFEAALLGLGITTINQEECIKLVGVGSDGAAANIANASIKWKPVPEMCRQKLPRKSHLGGR